MNRSKLSILILIPLIYLFVVGCGKGAEEAGIPGPAGLWASSITQNSFILHWSAVSGADYYKVYRHGGFYRQTAATSCSITGLSSGTTYRMTVSYVKDSVESNQSASRYVTTAE